MKIKLLKNKFSRRKSKRHTVKWLLSLFVITMCQISFAQVTINSEDFESGWGIWNDGGSDCDRVLSSPLGSGACIELTDGIGSSDPKTSVFSNALDITSYVAIDIVFDFRTDDFSDDDDFYVEYSTNGSTWIKIGDFNINAAGRQFNDATTYIDETISIDNSTEPGAFSATTIFRFRCSATSGPNEGDKLFLDNIEIIGHSPSALVVKGNGNVISDNDSTPNNIDDTYFESTVVGFTISKTYTIENLETVSVDITSISCDNTEFSISSAATPFSISAGASATFTVTYNASLEGRSEGVITVSNSLGDGSYEFSVLGEIATASNFNQDGHWKYLDDGSDQGSAWSALAFDDSGWESGDAKFGYGEADITTTVDFGPDGNNKYPTTYFRKKVNISAADLAFTSLKMNAIRDDGIIVYINGVEVWRDHISGTVNYLTFADSPAIGGSDETTWISQTISNPFTVAGEYEIAVEIHQVNATSSDLGFNFSLELINELLGAGGEWSYYDQGMTPVNDGDGDNWTELNYNENISVAGGWPTGNAELGYGDGDEVTTISYGADSANKYITTYFRKTITATADHLSYSTLLLSIVRDDGIVVYINGVEVLRNNMPTGTIDFNTTAFGNVSDSNEDFESFWNIFTIANTLVLGANEIAVEVHQYSASSSDLSFNMSIEANNDIIVVPGVKPDNDGDGVEDYVDVDDDNDGIPDLVEGCHTTNPESLETEGDGETVILDLLPITTAPLGDGNEITYTIDDVSNFNTITAFNAQEHGFAIRVRGPITSGELTFEFTDPVDNLFFKLIDFDEDETFKVDVYDDAGNIVDLTNEEGMYHLGSYVEYLGNNTITDRYDAGAPNANNPDNRADDIYSSAYFYFPNISVKKIVFTIDYTGGGTVRIAGVQYCTKDTDGDDVDDFYDSDSDNDGIPDLVEAGGVDVLGTGLINASGDNDGDGIINLYDPNPDTYFIEEVSLLTDMDFDNDGVPNRLDLDSDNDGIVDILEISLPDVNGDGQIDSFSDVDSDGYHDAFDGAGSLLITGADTNADGFPNTYPNANIDGQGYPNFLDIDADGDGITDHTEAQITNTPSFVSYTYNSDTDGILDVFDNSDGSFGGNGLIPVDSDGDGTPDFLDDDSDDDGENDYLEGHDTNGDGVVDGSDTSCLTSLTSNLGEAIGSDTDADGLDDGFDNVDGDGSVGTYDPSNGGLTPYSHPNIDRIATDERDWREPNILYPFINFDGVNDYIDFADKHRISSSFTIETWVKQNASSSGNGIIVGKRDCNKGTNLGYQIGLENHFPVVKWYSNSGGAPMLELKSGHAIDTDRWYHLVIIYDESNTNAEIYIDGILTASDNSVSGSPEENTESFLIGAKFDDAENTHKLSDKFYGWIDEIRIWNKALTTEQFRMMMNQEIEQNGTNVRGKVVPIDIPGLLWEDLEGYYPMNIINGSQVEDHSKNTYHGRMRNIADNQDQTAPMPYTTRIDGQNWSEDNTWTNFDVWDAPNGVGVEGTVIDWNIVELSHNVNSGDKDIKVLGMVSNSGKLSIADPNDALDENNSGKSLRISHYLELDGELDLIGESQLLQDEGSILDQDSGGFLEKDQQGTANSFNYNYWASSVGVITPSGVGQRGTGVNNTANNATLGGVFKDGSDSSNPLSISFNGSYTWADGSYSGNKRISSYWFYKFNGTNSDYNSWVGFNENSSLLPGEGYTMKGTSGSVSITDNQNYVFKGKPNNGDITLPIAAGNDRLVGNPYPSALDADEFIMDNISETINSKVGRNTDNIFNGALYFWDHFGEENTHILRDYVGGYATYTLMGGARAYSNDERINNNGSYGSKIPGRYIPVNQGFFVIASLDTVANSTVTIQGGDIVFKNSQRVFQREAVGSSVFMKSSKKTQGHNNANIENEIIDSRAKIRLMFDSPRGYHRQILIGEDTRTTNNFDLGFDAPLADVSTDDMFWVLDGSKLVIQGVPSLSDEQEFPLGINMNESGKIVIRIDELENIDDSKSIYIKDALIGETYKLNSSSFEIELEAGEYLDRFKLVFQPRLKRLDEVEKLQDGINVFTDNNSKELKIRRIVDTKLIEIQLYNTIGQLVKSWNSNLDNRNIDLPLSQSTGVYILRMNTTDGKYSKKVLIK